MPLFGREIEQKVGKMQVGVVGGSLAGQAAPAKQRVRCDAKVSTLFRQSHTLISDKSQTKPHQARSSRSLCFSSSSAPHDHKGACTSARSAHKFSRDRERDDVLLIPPVAAEQ